MNHQFKYIISNKIKLVMVKYIKKKIPYSRIIMKISKI
jgi:hypothetical protein